MTVRSTIFALALTCVPAVAAAQSAAPALPRLDAPTIGMTRPNASLLPASMEAARAQEPLPRSRLHYSAPLSAALGVAGLAAGYLTGVEVLDCQDAGDECATGPDGSEYGLAALGLAIGSAAGAHIGGKQGTSKGDPWLTLAAAAAGALPLVLGDPGDNNALTLIGGGLSIGGAVATDHFVRRPR
jgi:hypothetical protein